MRKPAILLAWLGLGVSAGAQPQQATTPPPKQQIDNPKIDAQGFLDVSHEALAQRAHHRLSERDFIKASGERGTVVLDARSREKYDLLHVRGAINLDFSDMSYESLARVLPDKNARILIYCNNNFVNDERAFPGKAVRMPLNVPTYITLYTYGYRNVWELGPLLDAKHTKIPLEPTR